jgi:hypothetical protein
MKVRNLTWTWNDRLGKVELSTPDVRGADGDCVIAFLAHLPFGSAATVVALS